jgi:hypothetical protein
MATVNIAGPRSGSGLPTTTPGLWWMRAPWSMSPVGRNAKQLTPAWLQPQGRGLAQNPRRASTEIREMPLRHWPQDLRIRNRSWVLRLVPCKVPVMPERTKMQMCLIYRTVVGSIVENILELVIGFCWATKTQSYYYLSHIDQIFDCRMM